MRFGATSLRIEARNPNFCHISTGKFLANNCLSLQELSLFLPCAFRYGHKMREMWCGVESFDQLKKVDIVTDVELNDLISFLAKAPKLERLILKMVLFYESIIDYEDFTLDSLKHIEVTVDPSAEEPFCLMLLDFCTSLERLVITSSNPALVAEILDEHPTLKSVRFCNAENVQVPSGKIEQITDSCMYPFKYAEWTRYI